MARGKSIVVELTLKEAEALVAGDRNSFHWRGMDKISAALKGKIVKCSHPTLNRITGRMTQRCINHATLLYEIGERRLPMCKLHVSLCDTRTEAVNHEILSAV